MISSSTHQRDRRTDRALAVGAPAHAVAPARTRGASGPAACVGALDAMRPDASRRLDGCVRERAYSALGSSPRAASVSSTAGSAAVVRRQDSAAP